MNTNYRGIEWAERLLSMADAANVPDDHPNPDWWPSEVEFELSDGWKMAVFYDVGDLDYIEHFVAPDGQIIDFWDWPDITDLGEDEWCDLDKNMLMGCRGTRIFA